MPKYKKKCWQFVISAIKQSLTKPKEKGSTNPKKKPKEKGKVRKRRKQNKTLRGSSDFRWRLTILKKKYHRLAPSSPIKTDQGDFKSKLFPLQYRSSNEICLSI